MYKIYMDLIFSIAGAEGADIYPNSCTSGDSHHSGLAVAILTVLLAPRVTIAKALAYKEVGWLLSYQALLNLHNHNT